MGRKEYEKQRNTLYAEAQSLIEAGKLDEANEKMDAIKKLDENFEAAAKAAADLRAMADTPAPIAGIGENEVIGGSQEEQADMYDSVEYRKAFMNYVLKGEAIPKKFRNANETTKTTDIGAVIAPKVINRIYELMEATGMLMPLVTKTSFAAGVTVPTSSVKPVATWVAEGGTSDRQKKPVGQIDIKGYKLRCAVSMTLESSVMSLELFETLLAKSVSEAMVKAQEQSFISGSGTGQPKGVLLETVAAGQNVDIGASADVNYQTLVDAEAALPLAYENGAVWNMTKRTFMKFVGMTDANGQPIARVNHGINGKPERTLLGRRVVLNDYMTSLGAAIAADTVVAFLFDWSDYMFNVNYNMIIKTYEDNDTEDQITKVVMICDGKAVDINSLVTVTKKHA